MSDTRALLEKFRARRRLGAHAVASLEEIDQLLAHTRSEALAEALLVCEGAEYSEQCEDRIRSLLGKVGT